MRAYNHERDRVRHENNDPHNCAAACDECDKLRAAPKLQCKTCKPTSYLTNKALRTEIADMLEELAMRLRGDERIPDTKDWQAKLLAGEPSTIERTYLLFAPPAEMPAIIPFEVLNTEWRAWWGTFTAAVLPEQKKSSEYAEQLKGNLCLCCEISLPLVTDLLRKEHCTLQDIRWFSLLTGAREPTKLTEEISCRVAEVKKLLPHLMGVPYERCLKILIDNEETAKFLVDNVSLLKEKCTKLSEPAKEALLAFKDRLRIPDNEWPFVVETFNLSSDASIHHIRKLRTTTNDEFGVQTTLGGRGCEYDIRKLLEHLLKTSPPKDATKPIRIKFAFDGANVTSGRRKQQEIGTLEILNDKTVSEAKSYKNCYQWLIYLGAEEKEELRQELARAIPVINDLNTKKKVNIML